MIMIENGNANQNMHPQRFGRITPYRKMLPWASGHCKSSANPCVETPLSEPRAESSRRRWRSRRSPRLPRPVASGLARRTGCTRRPSLPWPHSALGQGTDVTTGDSEHILRVSTCRFRIVSGSPKRNVLQRNCNERIHIPPNTCACDSRTDSKTPAARRGLCFSILLILPIDLHVRRDELARLPVTWECCLRKLQEESRPERELRRQKCLPLLPCIPERRHNPKIEQNNKNYYRECSTPKKWTREKKPQQLGPTLLLSRRRRTRAERPWRPRGSRAREGRRAIPAMVASGATIC